MKKLALIITSVFLVTHILGQKNQPKLKISNLTGDFYIYTTYNIYEGNLIPAHGMYLVTNNGVVLFDTPWDTTQFQPLIDSIKLKHNKNVTICIATHWHSDRTDGLEFYKQKGINTFTTKLTDELSKKNNKKRAEYLIDKDTVFNVGQYTFETYYPGQGHTVDNIVLWFKKEKLLYGGCLIKGADADNLGYLGDGNVLEYETTLKNVQSKFIDPKFIIVSHHDWNNINSLRNSIDLAKKLKRESEKISHPVNIDLSQTLGKYRHLSKEVLELLFGKLIALHKLEQEIFDRSQALKNPKEPNQVQPGENELWDEFRNRRMLITTPICIEPQEGGSFSFGKPTKYEYLTYPDTKISLIMKTANRAVVETQYENGIIKKDQFVLRKDKYGWKLVSKKYGFQNENIWYNDEL